MNFPHKSVALNDDREAAKDIMQQANHNALLAHVIARQSLSHSARAVVAHRMTLSSVIANKDGRSLDRRINFFAGHTDWQGHINSNQNSFVCGHFRPDIADQMTLGDGA